MSNILVTGANGFVGSHLVNQLKEKNNVISLIHTNTIGVWQQEAVSGTIQVQGDLRDSNLMREILAKYDIIEIYHTAALAKVKSAFRDTISVYDVNVMGTVNLLEAARIVDTVSKILVIITDKFYGEKMGATEDMPAYSKSEPYAASKICQKFVAESFADTYDMDIVLPHSCNIFGYDPYGNRIVPNVVKNCIKGKDPSIYHNDYSIREYIHIHDTIDALTNLMNMENATGSYNISTGYVHNQADIVKMILEFFPDLKARYQTVHLPKQIQEQSLASIKWDWKPKWSMEDAIKQTIETFKLYRSDWK